MANPRRTPGGTETGSALAGPAGGRLGQRVAGRLAAALGARRAQALLDGSAGLFHPSVFLQLGFAAGCLIGAVAGGAKLINLGYTPLAVALAFYLYTTVPEQFVAFTVWLWLLTPLARRLVDAHSTFHDPSLVMLAPMGATALCALALPRVGRLSRGVLICYAVVFYVIGTGYVLGLTNGAVGVVPATFGMATWACPALLSLYLAIEAERVPLIAPAVFRTMALGALVLGAYGLFQFFALPQWDQFWMNHADLGAIGIAQEGALRVFSTLNSPGVLAIALMMAVICSLAIKAPWRSIAVVLGFATFLLAQVRSAWADFALAYMFVLLTAPLRRKLNYGLIAVVLALATLPLLTIEPIATKITTRFASIANASADRSYQVRSDVYARYTRKALTTINGNGLGSVGVASRLTGSSSNVTFDSGVLELFLTFGLFAWPLIGALLALWVRALTAARAGPFANIAAAICFAILAQMLFADILYAPTGIFVHLFLGLALAYGQLDHRRRAAAARARVGRQPRAARPATEPALSQP